PFDTPHHRKFVDEAVVRLKQMDPSGPLPDRYVQANFEAMNALKVGMEKSKFEGRKDTMKLIESLEGLQMKLSDDFFTGDKVLRKEDHQAFPLEVIFEMKDGKPIITQTIPGEKTLFPPACKFSSAYVTTATSIDARSPDVNRGVASAPVLRTEMLTVRFGGLAALNQVNFEVQRGEIRAIIGPNGAGKSTFFNCLTGVLRPTAGKIYFGGEDI